MFNIGFMEWILIMTVVLLLIGPEQLPKVAQVMGQFLNELKRVIGSLQTANDTNHCKPSKQLPSDTLSSTDNQSSQHEKS